MKYKITYQFLAIILFISCTKQSVDVIRFDKNIQSAKIDSNICILHENRSLINKTISDIVFISDTTFVITSGNIAIVYNIDGEQVKLLNGTGRGPGECISPTSLYVSDKYIYVWDGALLKMLVYSFKGDFKDEYSGFEHAISKFVIYDNRYICSFRSGGIKEDVISVYDMSTRKTINRFGELNDSDILLMLRSNSGGLAVRDDQILFTNPSSLSVKSCGIAKEYDSGIYPLIIEDKEFNIEPFKTDAVDYINSSFIKALEYSYGNSAILDMHTYNNHVFILAEIGKLQLTPSSVENLSRRIKIYVLSEPNRPEYTITYPYYPMTAYTIYNDKLFFIGSKIEDDKNVMSLNSYSLSY